MYLPIEVCIKRLLRGCHEIGNCVKNVDAQNDIYIMIFLLTRRLYSNQRCFTSRKGFPDAQTTENQRDSV